MKPQGCIKLTLKESIFWDLTFWKVQFWLAVALGILGVWGEPLQEWPRFFLQGSALVLLGVAVLFLAYMAIALPINWIVLTVQRSWARGAR